MAQRTNQGRNGAFLRRLLKHLAAQQEDAVIEPIRPYWRSNWNEPEPGAPQLDLFDEFHQDPCPSIRRLDHDESSLLYD